MLHIEGEPYERGYQHGRLMAGELVPFIRCSASLMSATAPSDGWRNVRTLVNALFLRRYEKEYLEEMKGIADGATAAGRATTIGPSTWSISSPSTPGPKSTR